MLKDFNGNVDDLIRLVRFGGVIICVDGQSEQCVQFGTKSNFIGRVCKACNRQRSKKQYRDKKVLAEIMESNNVSTEELDPDMDDDDVLD